MVNALKRPESTAWQFGVNEADQADVVKQYLLHFIRRPGVPQNPYDSSHRVDVSALQTWVDRRGDLPLAQGGFRLLVSFGRPGSTEPVTFRREVDPGDAIDWDRWHELLDIRDIRPFTASEQQEYDTIAAVVARMDAEDAAIADSARARNDSQFEAALASIRRLTSALEAAANRRLGAKHPAT